MKGGRGKGGGMTKAGINFGEESLREVHGIGNANLKRQKI
jgi:hypothetical protein